jgi:hypothetical protein
MANSVGFHEDPAELSDRVKDDHRALTSVMEELEAIDWYAQRVDATTDAELGAILAHNRDEEKEHAAMVLEWLRRRDAKLDEVLRQYLFTDVPVLEIEAAADAAQAAGDDPAPAAGAADGDLRVRSLRGESL